MVLLYYRALEWRLINVSHHRLAQANGLPASWKMHKTVPLINLDTDKIDEVKAQLRSCLTGAGRQRFRTRSHAHSRLIRFMKAREHQAWGRVNLSPERGVASRL